MALWFKRREVWLPTWPATLLLVALGAVILVGAARLGPAWMAPNAPALGADGSGARTLVVEGWLSEVELDQALATARRGRYERILTTGGPIDAWAGVRNWSTFAARAADYIGTHAAPGDPPVIALPAPASTQDRTFLSAAMVRSWARRTGTALPAIDLYSAGVHARRTRMLYRMALGPTVEVGVLSARPQEYDAAHWWESSAGAKTVIGEALSLAWTVCCFWPPAPDSHEEQRSAPKTPA